jgi:DNA-binding transcriptional regulator/RsmH inhibitor MraZ
VKQDFLLFPLPMFKRLFDHVSEQAIADVALQEALAFLGSQSRFCRCDKQGRMALDREKLDSIGVKKNLKLIGAVTHIRLCAPENWVQPDNPDEYLDEIQQVSDGSDGLDVLGGLLQGISKK